MWWNWLIQKCLKILIETASFFSFCDVFDLIYMIHLRVSGGSQLQYILDWKHYGQKSFLSISFHPDHCVTWPAAAVTSFRFSQFCRIRSTTFNLRVLTVLRFALALLRCALWSNFHPKIPASILTLDSTNLIWFWKFKVMVKVIDIFSLSFLGKILNSNNIVAARVIIEVRILDKNCKKWP